MSSPKTSGSPSSTTSIAEGIPQPELGPVLEIPRPSSSNSLESMKNIVPDGVKAKYRAQGYKKGGGAAISATIFPVIIYFIYHEVEPFLMASYFIIAGLAIILSTIEPLLVIYFKKSDRLHEDIEKVIILKLKSFLAWCYYSHGIILAYIFSQ